MFGARFEAPKQRDGKLGGRISGSVPARPASCLVFHCLIFFSCVFCVFFVYLSCFNCLAVFLAFFSLFFCVILYCIFNDKKMIIILKIIKILRKLISIMSVTNIKVDTAIANCTLITRRTKETKKEKRKTITKGIT